MSDLVVVGFDTVDEALCVFWPAQRFLEARETEAVMDALTKDTAKLLLTFENSDIHDSKLFEFCGSC